ncbi:epididymal-specific lipocalin-9 isoform X2 [Mus musculus]|uniref:epididymal-specific lipocalin-9 isoform X2 n=1 Tax=Mus musculus TaxID=10090 RepID=UPI0003D78F98|nr:epididymal-specific lipocalin-9 isoform X2 [Mus musculus]|eukprot:XP_017174828.1 PREDICTED: epididymal-specific lipocalin-9 isoform X2 [Mus musculus]
MRVPHIPSHDGNQRVQKELWEKWSRGRAEKAEGGPSLELMFRDSPRIETVRAKQSQRWYRTPPLSLSFQISGTWYLDSIASDNMTRIEENGDLRLFIRNIKLLNNGSLQFDFHFMLQGECVAVTMVCEKTKNNGEFSVAYEGKNKVLLLETDYSMYIIFYMQNIKNGTKTQVLALYGRSILLDKTHQREFENICNLYGLDSQNIIDMTKKDFCFL